jgi:hypothetical protein
MTIIKPGDWVFAKNPTERNCHVPVAPSFPSLEEGLFRAGSAALTARYRYVQGVSFPTQGPTKFPDFPQLFRYHYLKRGACLLQIEPREVTLGWLIGLWVYVCC